MASEFSTGSLELDALLEELRAGDNVVLYTSEPADYWPFAEVLAEHVRAIGQQLVYVRASGSLDTLLAGRSQVRVFDLATIATNHDLAGSLRAVAERIGPRAYYLFDPLAAFSRWLPLEEEQRDFLLAVCPFLFQQQAIAYWGLDRGVYRPATIAAIKDCTQILIAIEHVSDMLVLTPLKVWGRYSEPMFRSHQVYMESGELHVHPLPSGQGDQQAYVRALADKNRELSEIRDALHRSNQELTERYRDLAELNTRLSEQSRLYQSLRVNLDHLLALFRAGQAIGSTLAVEQVRRAIVAAALRLFDCRACRLELQGDEERATIEIAEGLTPAWQARLAHPAVVALRQRVRQTQMAQGLALYDNLAATLLGSVAMAPIMVRSGTPSILEVYADDARLDDGELLTLLSYLASEAGIALENAQLYREVEMQDQQLRSFVENVITKEEQESRQLAFDLHDGLVQMIVASYQHLQTAQGWRLRNPAQEERELAQGVQLLQRAIFEARRLIGQLRPAGLDDFGLVQALRLYVAQLAADAEWQVSLRVDPNWSSLPAALEAALFRIVQEATTNARKYAAALRVEIWLQVGAEHFCVSIRDWGKGFDPAKVATVPHEGLHMGLIGIRERARLWGGSCAIKSQPGKGTTIEVCIPRNSVDQEQKDQADD
jgi:two-component system, NarL family, sensor kinase